MSSPHETPSAFVTTAKRARDLYDLVQRADELEVDPLNSNAPVIYWNLASAIGRSSALNAKPMPALFKGCPELEDAFNCGVTSLLEGDISKSFLYLTHDNGSIGKSMLHLLESGYSISAGMSDSICFSNDEVIYQTLYADPVTVGQSPTLKCLATFLHDLDLGLSYVNEWHG